MGLVGRKHSSCPRLGARGFQLCFFFFFSALFLFLTQRQALEHRLLYSA